MRERIEKKLAGAKIFKIVILALLVIGAALIFVHPAFVCLVMLDLFLVLIYVVNWLPATRSVKYIRRRGLEDAIDDINPKEFILKKSKISCGKRMLYCKKPFMLVPYEKAVWVYRTVRKGNGITMGKKWNFCMDDGKKFSFEAKEEELLWFLNNYRANFSGKLIFGYSTENEKMYRKLVRRSKN